MDPEATVSSALATILGKKCKTGSAVSTTMSKYSCGIHSRMFSGLVLARSRPRFSSFRDVGFSDRFGDFARLGFSPFFSRLGDFPRVPFVPREETERSSRGTRYVFFPSLTILEWDVLAVVPSCEYSLINCGKTRLILLDANWILLFQ